MRVTTKLARRHYAEQVQKAWYPELEAFITGGPIVAMIVEGPRRSPWSRNGLRDQRSEGDPGTVRGDYGAGQQMNLVTPPTDRNRQCAR